MSDGPDPGMERAAVEWVESLHMLGMRFGLERMRAILDVLGEPQRLPAIHVVGTNGKSSTTRLAASALSATGRRVGAYTSPHVTGWRERIEVAGQPISGPELGSAVLRVRDAADSLGLPEGDGVTQFEALTAAAFVAFREAGVDAMVVEAGLGGRYDASNVLPDDAVVALTNIALEHTDLLGDTLEGIAAEKLAVAPEGSDRVVIGRLEPAARRAVEKVVDARGLRPWRHAVDHLAEPVGEGVRVRTPLGSYGPVAMTLRGGFQRDNLALALASAERLVGAPLGVEAAVAAGRLRVPGRMELVEGAPRIVLDGAHNPAGMRALASALPDAVADGPRVAVVSVLGDKDASGMLAALADSVDRLVATRSSHGRAADPASLAQVATACGLPAEAQDEPAVALRTALRAAGPGGTVVVCGSLYLLADLRPGLVEVGEEHPDTLARARDGASLTDQAKRL